MLIGAKRVKNILGHITFHYSLGCQPPLPENPLFPTKRASLIFLDGECGWNLVDGCPNCSRLGMLHRKLIKLVIAVGTFLAKLPFDK